MNVEDTIARVDANATGAGFARIEAEGFDSVWHRRRFMASRFGFVDSIVALRASSSAVTVDDLRRAGDDAFAVALATKTKAPRGLGSSVEVHPITIADEATPEAVEYVRTQSPNRWCAMTMHALIHGQPPTIVMFDQRKVWGGAYVKASKRQLADLVA